MIDFPNAPTTGQVFKTGNLTYKFNGTGWLSNPPNSAVADAPLDGVLYGRRNQAWFPCGQTVTFTLADGTIPSPGLAWQAEQGFGWYRQGASFMGVAAQGATVTTLDASTVNTQQVWWSRVANRRTTLLVANGPAVGASGYNTLSMYCDNNGDSYIKAGAGGSGSFRNLFLDAPQVLLNQDGTVAAPSIAFGSEPGTGFYRNAASSLGVAMRGGRTFEFVANTTANSYQSIYPVVAGASNFYLFDVPPGAANAHNFAFQNNGNGYFIFESLAGAATAKPLTMTFPGGVNVNGANILQDVGGVYTNYLALYKPDASSEVSLAFMNRATGQPIGRFLNASSGVLVYQNFDASGAFLNQPLAITQSTGSVNINNNVLANGGISLAANSAWTSDSTYTVFQLNANTCDFYYTKSSGSVTWRVNGNTTVVWDLNGNAAKASGAGPWNGLSDIRIKDNIRDYTQGLDAILALRPRWYSYRGETGRDTTPRVGLIAQESMGPMPETVTIAPGKAGDIELDDMHTIDIGPVTWALVNSVKTLKGQLDDALSRIEALEARLTAH